MRQHIEQTCSLGPDKCDYYNYDNHPDLFTCAVCDLSEGELTSVCPGVKIPYDMGQLCCNGLIDFNGTWVILHSLSAEEDAAYNSSLFKSNT